VTYVYLAPQSHFDERSAARGYVLISIMPAPEYSYNGQSKPFLKCGIAKRNAQWSVP
jgi:hypothetical protein